MSKLGRGSILSPASAANMGDIVLIMDPPSMVAVANKLIEEGVWMDTGTSITSWTSGKIEGIVPHSFMLRFMERWATKAEATPWRLQILNAH